MYTNLFRDKCFTELEVWWTFIDWERSGKWETYQYIFLLFLKWQMLIKSTEALNSIICKLHAFYYLVSYSGEGDGTHSSTLAWKIPWTKEPGGLQSMGVSKSRTQLSDFTFTFHFHALEKTMATHSSTLAWKIPWTEKPGGLQSMGSHRVRHDWSDLAAAAVSYRFMSPI